MALSIAELKAIASLDTKGFEAGAKNITRSTKDAAGSLAPLKSGLSSLAGRLGAVFSVAALGMYTKQMMTAATQVERTAAAIGMSAGQLNELNDMVQLTGASTDGFQSKLVKLQESQEKAILGDKNLIDAFRRLGITERDLMNMPLDQILVKVARGAQDAGGGVSELNEIMGRGTAAEYAAVLRDIAEQGMPAVTAATEREIAAAAALNTAWTSAGDAISDAFRGAVVSALQFVRLIDDNEVLAQRIWQQEQERDKRDRESKRALAKERERMLNLKKAEILAMHGTNVAEAQNAAAAAIEKITVSAPQAADRLARIGGMIGGQTSREKGAAERAAKAAEITAELDKKIAALNEKMAVDLGKIQKQTAE